MSERTRTLIVNRLLELGHEPSARQDIAPSDFITYDCEKCLCGFHAAKYAHPDVIATSFFVCSQIEPGAKPRVESFTVTVKPLSPPCVFRVNATGETGINTGRMSYRVECVTCSELLHEATTGTMYRIEQHLKEKANQ